MKMSFWCLAEMTRWVRRVPPATTIVHLVLALMLLWSSISLEAGWERLIFLSPPVASAAAGRTFAFTIEYAHPSSMEIEMKVSLFWLITLFVLVSVIHALPEIRHTWRKLARRLRIEHGAFGKMKAYAGAAAAIALIAAPICIHCGMAMASA